MKTQTMKAVIATAYGSPEVLQIQDVQKPTPASKEILVKIIAVPITAADTMMREGTPRYARLFLGWNKPKQPIPGTGFAGRVVAVGKDVHRFQVNDEVFGETAFHFSSNAEYVCISEDGVVAHKPENISFEEAAAICDGAVTSMNFLREIGKVKKGQKVLINGASGSLGTAAVQLAKFLGAKVTGVCSTKNVELVRSLGADLVIDYTKTDFTKGNKTYDLIYDTVGKSSFRKCKRILKADGAYLSPVLSLSLLLQMMKTSIVGRKKAKFAATGTLPAKALHDMMMNVVKIMQIGRLHLVIDRRYMLEEIVEAHEYVDSGHKRGNVVMLV
jgi:NADPH:quinone reductase-like Zn-dependent oxidoreductase